MGGGMQLTTHAVRVSDVAIGAMDALFKMFAEAGDDAGPEGVGSVA